MAVIGEAQDGLEAVEKIEKLRRDLLLLDIELPDPESINQPII